MDETSTATEGILTKQDIEYEIDHNGLIEDARRDNIQACSYDLRIGTIFRDGQIINESHAQASDQVVVKPGEIVSIFTQEQLHLPDNMAATAFAINRMSSRGFLILNPGHIDPGFDGPLTIKAINVRKADLAISRGMDIFTVIFERLPKRTTRPFSNEKARDRRERDFNAEDVETAAKSLSSLVALGEDAPYPTYSEVRDIIAREVPIRTTEQVNRPSRSTGYRAQFSF